MGIWNFFKKKQKASPTYLTKEGLLRLPRGESFLPHRCIYCNAAVNKLQKVKVGDYFDCRFPYLPSSISAFILFVLDDMFGGMVSYIFGKVIIVNLGICEKHRYFRLLKKIMWFSIMGITLVLDYILIFIDFSWSILFSNILLIIFTICFLDYFMTILKITKEDSSFIYVKGCDKVFLNSLIGLEHEVIVK